MLGLGKRNRVAMMALIAAISAEKEDDAERGRLRIRQPGGSVRRPNSRTSKSLSLFSCTLI